MLYAVDVSEPVEADRSKHLLFGTISALFATAAQGALAGAIQSGDLAPVALSGQYGDLAGLPTLGTAAAGDIGDQVQAFNALLAQIAALTPGAPETGYVLTWNGSTIVLSAAAAGGASITLDTMANILASTPDAGDMFYATDHERFLVYDGSTFQMASPLFATKATTPNAGAIWPVVESDDPNGYYQAFITNKVLHNSTFGANNGTTEGGFRLSSGEIQFYLNGAWKTVVLDIRIREDDAGGIFLEFNPLGSSMWINTTSGNSDLLGLNGKPIVHAGQRDAGAYPAPTIVGGRSLT